MTDDQLIQQLSLNLAMLTRLEIIRRYCVRRLGDQVLEVRSDELCQGIMIRAKDGRRHAVAGIEDDAKPAEIVRAFREAMAAEPKGHAD